jgi:hypothetical protein
MTEELKGMWKETAVNYTKFYTLEYIYGRVE